MSPIARGSRHDVPTHVPKAGLLIRQSPHFAVIAVNGGITAWRYRLIAGNAELVQKIPIGKMGDGGPGGIYANVVRPRRSGHPRPERRALQEDCPPPRRQRPEHRQGARWPLDQRRRGIGRPNCSLDVVDALRDQRNRSGVGPTVLDAHQPRPDNTAQHAKRRQNGKNRPRPFRPMSVDGTHSAANVSRPEKKCPVTGGGWLILG
jgi:hypothetical protein